MWAMCHAAMHVNQHKWKKLVDKNKQIKACKIVMKEKEEGYHANTGKNVKIYSPCDKNFYKSSYLCSTRTRKTGVGKIDKKHELRHCECIKQEGRSPITCYNADLTPTCPRDGGRKRMCLHIM